MQELPTGTVTFLFTDIERSTRLLSELGDEYADVLAEHHRRIRDAVGRHGGIEMGTQGDGFSVVFPRAGAPSLLPPTPSGRSPPGLSGSGWACTPASPR